MSGHHTPRNIRNSHFFLNKINSGLHSWPLAFLYFLVSFWALRWPSVWINGLFLKKAHSVPSSLSEADGEVGDPGDADEGLRRLGRTCGGVRGALEWMGGVVGGG